VHGQWIQHAPATWSAVNSNSIHDASRVSSRLRDMLIPCHCRYISQTLADLVDNIALGESTIAYTHESQQTINTMSTRYANSTSEEGSQRQCACLRAGPGSVCTRVVNNSDDSMQFPCNNNCRISMECLQFWITNDQRTESQYPCGCPMPALEWETYSSVFLLGQLI
jgi:hypothetical protein